MKEVSLMKNISILGSTGSIGTQALDIIRDKKDSFRVVAMSTNKNIDLLLEQIKEFKPEFSNHWLLPRLLQQV